MTESKSLAETEGLAQDFLANLVPAGDRATIIGLSGDLGSGKTTFVQFLARALGIRENITSPTFVIEKVYRLERQKFQKLIHVDAYRLENGGELARLGFAELVADSKNLIVVEWPERVAEVLSETKNIYFKFVDEEKRQISFA